MAAMSLELFDTGDSLDGRMRAVAQGTVLVDVIKGLLGEARTALEDSVRQVSEATGTAFTARKGGVSALVTDPKPKPRVSDPEAFGRWVVAKGGAVEVVTRVEVVDHAAAAEALGYYDEKAPTDAVEAAYLFQSLLSALGNSLAVRTEYVLPSDPFAPLVDKGRVVVTPDGVVDVDTGELVPGTAVTVANPTLQVRLDKRARAEAARQVRETLGLPELEEAS
jgi:hypothetical protein